MKINILVLTTTRADFGLLKDLVNALSQHQLFSCAMAVGGNHADPKYGYSIEEVRKESSCPLIEFATDRVDTDEEGMIELANSTSIGVAKAIATIRPRFLMVLGDRFEILSGCLSAVLMGVPIIHLHGGEQTLGAIDDSVRHAITKLSAIHFVSTDLYRQRVIQLGESDETVFNVGALGVDQIVRTNFESREQISRQLGLVFRRINILVAYHPVTNSSSTNSLEECSSLLNAMRRLENEIDDIQFIFTAPNADFQGLEILRLIENFSKTSTKSILVRSLGIKYFHAVVRECDFIIGNSSSGILESTALKTIAVNIGVRQLGRISADNIINCNGEEDQIYDASIQAIRLSQVIDWDNIVNPYLQASTIEKILDKIVNLSKIDFKSKKFIDISRT